MFLSNFPSSPDCICCSKKSKGVLVSPIFIDLVAFYLVILTIKDWLTVMFMFCCSLKKPSREAAFPAFLPHSPPTKKERNNNKNTHTHAYKYTLPLPFCLNSENESCCMKGLAIKQHTVFMFLFYLCGGFSYTIFFF